MSCTPTGNLPNRYIVPNKGSKFKAVSFSKSHYFWYPGIHLSNFLGVVLPWNVTLDFTSIAQHHFADVSKFRWPAKILSNDLFLLETNGPMFLFLRPSTFETWQTWQTNLAHLAVHSRHKKRSQTLLVHFLLPLLWYAVYLGKNGGSLEVPWTFL